MLRIIKISTLMCTCLLGNGQTKSTPQDLEVNVNVFPNPSEEYINVVFSGFTSSIQLELHSIIGNKIIIEPEYLSAGKIRLPIRHLTSGYYFIIIEDTRHPYKKAFKFLKE